jgi:hypothetical protein
MQLRLLLALVLISGAAGAQTQKPAHPLTYSPPPRPPIVLEPLPPTKTGEPSKLCTREVFVPCPDERGRNCTRKETYRC